MPHRKLIPLVSVLLLAVPFPWPSSASAQPASTGSHARRSTWQPASSHARLTEDERTLQMLNRFTFGPRPDDPALVREAGGPEAWFERQLQPETIPDTALDARLAQYPALSLPVNQLLYNFPSRQDIRQVADGKRPLPQDPLLAGLYETLVAKYNRKQKEDEVDGKQAGAPLDPAKAAQRKQDQAEAQRLIAPILLLPPGERMARIMRLPVADRILLTAHLAGPQKAQLLAAFSPRERDLFLSMGAPNATAVVANELVQAKVLRAILSERQLQEVMTDFWFNHFNVFLHKNQDNYYTASYERDAIRPYALGKFHDLLLATARHPAMLVYLDNWQSIGPDSMAARRQKNNGKPQRGLNENYGREVMELHTVGVNGGYSQADVTALSEILTGWTIDHPENGGGFIFDPRRHQPGTKAWFDQTVQESGYTEGQQALTWLAAQPQTAHFISYKLAQRFVADDPPPTLVNRMALVFLSSDGDIRQVLRAMVHSPEFWSRDHYRNKVKTPLEFVASAFRATETDPANPAAIAGVLNRMGEPLYGMQPPTGYPMTADHWMNSAALVDRLNFSLALANSRVPDTPFDAPRLLAQEQTGNAPSHAASLPAAPWERDIALKVPRGVQPALTIGDVLPRMEQMLTGAGVSARTDSVIRQQLASSGGTTGSATSATTADTMAALILGSPEFQMR